MIIGLCGFIGSGKDTVGNILRDNHKFTKVSFAGTLKDVVSVLFTWDRKLLEGDTAESRQWREKKDDWWSQKFGYDVTPRLMLQRMGTEATRKAIHNDIWVIALERIMSQSKHKDFVVTDVRFPNEILSIVKTGGEVYEVQRGEKPLWYHSAYIVNRAANVEAYESHKQALPHESEWKWVGNPMLTGSIDNNGTLDDLESTIGCLLAKL